MVVVELISVFGKQECEFFTVNTPSAEQVAKTQSVGEPADAATQDLSLMSKAFESNAEEKQVDDPQ